MESQLFKRTQLYARLSFSHFTHLSSCAFHFVFSIHSILGIFNFSSCFSFLLLMHYNKQAIIHNLLTIFMRHLTSYKRQINLFLLHFIRLLFAAFSAFGAIIHISFYFIYRLALFPLLLLLLLSSSIESGIAIYAVVIVMQCKTIRKRNFLFMYSTTMDPIQYRKPMEHGDVHRTHANCNKNAFRCRDVVAIIII